MSLLKMYNKGDDSVVCHSVLFSFLHFFQHVFQLQHKREKAEKN